MMRWLISATVYALLTCGALAQGGMMPGPGTPHTTGGGGCTQATAFLARNGNAHPTETTTLICGLVTDGDFASLDALYIFATDTQAHAILNLVSTSFTASPVTLGTPITFTANLGFSTTDTGTCLDTTFIPSTAGGHYSQNSASFGFYNLTSSVAADSTTNMGINNLAWIIPNQSATVFVDVNDGNFPSIAAVNHQGMYVATRTAASGAGATAAYRNSSASAFLTDTGASASNPTVSFFVNGANNAGACTRAPAISPEKVAAAFIGGALTSAASVRISNRINAYMTTLGINVY